ncbi:MAG TPA: sugar ABC transporter permease [Ruminiclostridium sp.]|nr:sugar ABC transporter permease [Ruminiclostridium sp.]
MSNQTDNVRIQKPFYKVLFSKFAEAGPLIALLLVVIIFASITDSFLTTRNMLSILKQSSAQCLVALGILLAILTGGNDLSVGSTLGLSMVIMGLTIHAGWNPYLSMLVCALTGAFLGLCNGLIFTKGKLPHPYIVTLGTLNIYRGLCLIITHGTPVSGMPSTITFLGSYSIEKIFPVCIFVVLLFYIIWWFMLTRTTFGRHIYAVGGNPAAARLAGINVNWVLTAVYTLSGLVSGMAALLLCGRTNSIFPTAGQTWETNAIAAVIIGGASFSGGRGSVLGTLTGVLLIQTTTNGLNILGMSSDWQTVFLGSMIILSVFIDVIRNGGFKSVKSLVKNNNKADVKK